MDSLQTRKRKRKTKYYLVKKSVSKFVSYNEQEIKGEVIGVMLEMISKMTINLTMLG